MSAVLMVPIDETGALVDSSVTELIQNAVTDTVSDVFVFSHGWWTNADRAMVDYSRFLLGFNQAVAKTGVPVGLTPPTNSVAIGLHWPSMYSEDPNAFANIFQVMSFHTMETRTYVVGQRGGHDVIAAIWQWVIAHPNASLRLHMIGHSFGCRVACYSFVSAMADVTLLRQFMNRPAVVRITLALLEPAMPYDVLALDRPYGILQSYGQPLRILTTRSDLDTALMNSNYYPAAEATQPADQFDLSQTPATPPLAASRLVPALGGQGPDGATLAAYNSGNTLRHDLLVDAGFQCTNVAWGRDRLLVADLTPLHRAHRQQDAVRPPGMPVPPGRPMRPTDPGGYHSDIYCDEVYQLLIGALFS